ncbi:LPD1 domain-containing protein [Paenibacillus aestuarii]|uniref:LPD1 domain-containing protein n=1 Tax=Paenibacillus aestuarii TaxID=516965 RepID=A0ABW0K2P0_9BACL|nr:LPD1 domain-containing protein [Paenibacillus aestuarii]
MLRDAKREVPKEFFITTEFSSFYLDAKARGAYWRRDYELFARAFEAWIEDELVNSGMTNTYLVCGTRLGGPYPQGEERQAINVAFRGWWRVLLESGILHDEKIWRSLSIQLSEHI